MVDNNKNCKNNPQQQTFILNAWLAVIVEFIIAFYSLLLYIAVLNLLKENVRGELTQNCDSKKNKSKVKNSSDVYS